MSEYAGRDRYKHLPATVPATALISLHAADPVPEIPWGPDGAGAGGADGGDD